MSVFTRFRAALLLSLALLGILFSGHTARAKSPTLSPVQKGRIQAAYGRLPLAFEQNTGQTDKQVKFLSRGPGYALFLTPTQAVMSLQKGKSQASVLRMTLKGANASPAVTGRNKLPGQVNYLLGKDKSKWHTHIATYGQVAYKNVYKGVDLRYYGNTRQLEYDFIVRPGASANAIKLGFDGARSVALTKTGGLTLSTQGGAVQWHAPVCYQTVNGKRQSVAGRFVVAGSAARFAVGKYDHTKPLVIDPALEYAAFLNGANAVTVDDTGNAYITGEGDFSFYPGATTIHTQGNGVVVLKLNKTGTSVLYTTLIGGNGNSSGSGIAIDSSGYANVVGQTQATDFPVTDSSTAGTGGTAFVLQLTPDGDALYYSEYVKVGSGATAADAVAIDSTDNIYVAIETHYSSAYPLITYLAKLNDNGVFQTAAYIYGTGGGMTSPHGIAVGEDGNIYVAGTTTDAELSGANNTYIGSAGTEDAFAVKLSSSLAFQYVTYLRTGDYTTGVSIAADTDGNAYVLTYNIDFSATSGPTVTKLNPIGTVSLYHTLIDGYDDAAGIAVDSAGDAYFLVSSTSISVSGDEEDKRYYDDYDARLIQLSINGSVLEDYPLDSASGYEDEGVFAGAITGLAKDAAGNVYIIGNPSSEFSSTPGAYHTSSYVDAYVAKVDFVNPVPSINNISPTSAFTGSSGFTLVVTGQGFVDGVSVVYFGSTPLTTTYVSPSELDAAVPASALTSAGTRTVTVRNPAPGGGTSNGAAFSVVGTISLSVSPGVVYQGAPSFGKVTLPSPAGSGGVVVSLSSSDTATANVPSSVTIAAGQTSATFQISTATSVSADTSVTLTASGAGSTAHATIQVNTKYNVRGTITKTDGTPLGGVLVTASGTGTFTLTNYTTASVTIPVSGTVNVPLNVGPAGTIIDLRVGVSLSHPHVNQLKLTLVAPDGTAVVLKNTGTGGINLLTAYPVLDMPAQSLSAFSGKPVRGTWNLQVQNTGTSSGSVSLFDLNFTYQGTLTSTTTSKSNGTFSVGGLKAATYSVTPTLTGYSFSPSFRTVSVGPTVTGQDFTAGTNPILTSVSPTSAYAGDGSTTLTLTGTNFVNGSVVSFNGTALSTAFVSSTQLTAVVPASLLTSTGTASITVANPAPGGTSGAITFSVLPRLKSLSLSLTSVYSGTSVTGTVTLTGAAPISGTTITLASSNTGAATVPSSVTVAGGAISATFTVTTKAVTSSATVTITATGPGAAKTAMLTVKPITLSDLELSSAVAAGGTGVTATVTLSGPAPSGGTTVTPSSSNTAVAIVPSSVTVAAGQTTATFTVTTKNDTANTSVVIGVALGTVTKSKTLTVTPSAAVESLSVSPTSVKGGSATSTGTVTLTAPAPSGGLAVSLSSSNTVAATVASTLNIAAGATTAKFKITTYVVTSNKTVTITAATNGASKSATLTVTSGTAAPVTVQSLSVSPTSVKGGSATSTGTVTLTAPAPSGGLAVSLSSSNTAAATVAGTLNIAAGATTVKFKITTYAVASTQTVTITAAANGASKSATLTVTH